MPRMKNAILQKIDDSYNKGFQDGQESRKFEIADLQQQNETHKQSLRSLKITSDNQAEANVIYVSQIALLKEILYNITRHNSDY